jgi:hypothetical protein
MVRAGIIKKYSYGHRLSTTQRNTFHNLLFHTFKNSNWLVKEIHRFECVYDLLDDTF